VIIAFDGYYHAVDTSAQIVMLVTAYSKGRDLTPEEKIKIESRICLSCGNKVGSFKKPKTSGEYINTGCCERCQKGNKTHILKVKLSRSLQYKLMRRF
jgi:hypothetical protein